MTTRDFDILIYGATGFTGEFITKQAVNNLSNLRIAIAGRSDVRLRELVSRLEPNLPSGVSPPAILIADAQGDESALIRIISRAKVLINCTGPFRLLGRAIVSACVQARTHYVDIAGEPQHIEGSMAEFHEQAKENGVTIVPAAGFDSLVADVGSLCFTAPKLLEKTESQSDLQVHVDSFLKFFSGPHGGGVHVTTLRCILEAISSTKELNAIRKSLPRGLSTIKSLRAEKKDGFFRDERLEGNEYSTLFRGSDASVVRQSLRLSDIGASATGVLGSPNFAYGAYVVIGDWTAALQYMFAGFVCVVFNVTSWGRELILKYPRFFTSGFFSHEGPSLEQIEGTSFSMTMFGKATEQNGNVAARIVTKVSGPEPGYDATSKIVTSAAVTLLEDGADIPAGVLTPAAAFKNTQIISRLEESGALKFEVLS